MSEIFEPAIQYAKEWIRQKLGTLDNIPTELQNTIANICYKFAVQQINREAQPSDFPVDVFKCGDFRKGLKTYIKDSVFLTSTLEALPEMLREYREVLVTKSQQEIDDVTFTFLCMWKYRIANVLDKSLLRLKIEATIRRNKVDEVPNLYQLMSSD